MTARAGRDSKFIGDLRSALFDQSGGKRQLTVNVLLARRLMQEDPAIASGIATGELRPFRTSLLRGRD